MQRRSEALVSVDIEASGPSPSTASLLSIGACLVENPETGVYIELRPDPERGWDARAESVHGLRREHLDREGMPPADAMAELERWLADSCAGRDPLFVGFNAAFDWMFVADYFWRYLGRNPFGISALDLKSVYMARDGVMRWAETRRTQIDEQLGIEPDHNHHALDDARGQARLARVLLGLD